jgi:hypothetical protein
MLRIAEPYAKPDSEERRLVETLGLMIIKF